MTLLACSHTGRCGQAYAVLKLLIRSPFLFTLLHLAKVRGRISEMSESFFFEMSLWYTWWGLAAGLGDFS